MRLGRGDILGIKVTIDIDGDVDFLHDRIGRSKTVRPHLIAHDLLLMTALMVCHSSSKPAESTSAVAVTWPLHSRIWPE